MRNMCDSVRCDKDTKLAGIVRSTCRGLLAAVTAFNLGLTKNYIGDTYWLSASAGKLNVRQAP